MKLMTEGLKNTIPAIHTQKTKGDDAVAYARFYIPCSYNWYVIEYDARLNLFYGIMDGEAIQYGYFSVDDLENNGHVQVDMDFQPKSVKELNNYELAY